MMTEAQIQAQQAAPHPFAPRFEFAFTVSIELTDAVWLEPSSMGTTRAGVWAASGTFEGPRIRGRVLPMSGGDYPLVRPNGVIDFDARYFLEADDGTLIYLQSRGYRWAEGDAMDRMARNEPVDPTDYYMRVSPKFDVPAGPHEWLGKHIFVGVAEKVPKANRIHYFMLL
jgi:hypothetical protein